MVRLGSDPGVAKVTAYISGFPKSIQVRLRSVRRMLVLLMPKGTVQVMNYGVPTFKLNGKNVVHFAGYAKHIGFYPGSSVIAAFAKDLLPYVHAKGSVQFPHDKPLPVTLLKRMTKYRLKEMTK